MKTWVVVALALTAAAVRLIPLHFLHPLNWDELEYYRATAWIGEGLLPFRDFWEHHTPLMWFLFAPFTRLTESPGIEAILVLRWAQVPVWIATFALANVWMRNAGLEAFARWSALTIALASSLFMGAAVEFRVEAVGCLLVMAGLVFAQRERYFFAGAAFCLAAFANLRLGPLLAVAVMAILVMRRLRASAIVAGGLAALAACLAFFAATGSLRALWEQVWLGNLAEKYSTPVFGARLHRFLIPFGVRIIGSDRSFELAAVDVGGITVLLFGLAGLVLAFRRRGDLMLVAIVQIANVLFLLYMKFIYNYHFAMLAVLMVPLIAVAIERMPRRSIVVAILVMAWSVNAFASVFRGKELDRAYQNLIMREAHARTEPGDAVLSGLPWALRREPAYRFWFLPELARQLVLEGASPKYVPTDPPAAVVLDHNLFRWIATVQPELAPHLGRHYMPVWRELWIPAMNARLPGRGKAEWIAPRDGEYRVYSSARLAGHPWFRNPLLTASYKGADADRLTFTLPDPGAGPIRVAGLNGDVVRFKKGQRVSAINTSNQDVAVFLVPTSDRTFFRQPPDGVTLDAETARVTHVPRFMR